MHMHVSRFQDMRTTVELSDEIRAKLLDLAARRGERGFSSIVEEAVRRYLREEERSRQLAEAARNVIGAMKEDDAVALEDSVNALREGPWRAP